MISQVPEKQMHIVRWLLAIGWLTLIFSLFYDPVSVWLTDPSNTLSPFHLHPEKYLDPDDCVKLQDVCLPQPPYAMGARIFWAMVLPIGIMILILFGHEFWRRICPLYFFSQIPRALGIQRKRKVVNPDTGNIRYELAGVEKESWLGRNYLYLQMFLFYLGLNIRILFVNSDRTAMALFLLFTIASSIAVGYLFKGRSWCQYICPMAPVQMFYTGPRGLLGSDAHLKPPQSITQSMCRSVDTSGKEKSACVSCQSPCIDIDSERSYWEGITRHDQKVVFYTYFGLMFGFYLYYFLYAGNWEYYYSGAWTHEDGQLSSLLNPGFYIYQQAIPIPKIIASPITLAVCAGLSYLICQTLENVYRAFLKRKGRNISEEDILHVCFVLCTFISFNVFFSFGGRPNISLFPSWFILILNAFIVLVSSLWLHRSLGRSRDNYSRESLASSLRRQLNKLAVDWSKFLEGRSLQDLLPNEVYVLAKVLPGFSRADRLRVYKGVLQESLQEGNVQSADSLEVLKDVRKELNISDEEHYSVLAELGVEDPGLLDPQRQLSRENQLRIDSYRRALELVIQELVETGTPLSDAFERKQKQIMSLRQEYAITSAEQEQVLAEMFNQDGALLRTAETLLSQLQDLAVRYQALQNLVSNPQAPVYVLLRQAVQEKQKLIVTQLLSILEILGDTPEALDIARSIGVLAANILGDILRSNEEQSKWISRLSMRVIASLRQAKDLVTQSVGIATDINPGIADTQIDAPNSIRNSASTNTSTWSSIVAPTQIPEPALRSDVIIDVLMQLLQDIDPLVQAASLYALHQIDPSLGFQQARQLLDTKSIKDQLVIETAGRILGQGQTHAKNTVPTMIAQIKIMGRVERRVFQQSTVRVGREVGNDIIISDNRVSRQHAIFYLDEKGVSVKDLGSSNGLRIGKTQILDQQAQLQQGDVVRFSSGDDIVILVQWEMQAQQGDTLAEALGTLEKLLWLYKSSFFSGLKANVLIDLAKNSHVRVYRPEEEICRMGTVAHDLIVLIDGEARVSQSMGNQDLSGMILPGQTIGELEVLNHTNYAATVVASGTRTKTLRINAENFEAVLAQDTLLARNILELLSNRLQASLGQACSITQL
ncbi:cyclic nucleotide-binding protein [Nostoc sp. HK-01]|nr:cyclic nucleotide-binding protein [Nostoc sp. HK-01]